MSTTMTAVELANRLGWDPKRLRQWLRAAKRAGHPLLRSHNHNDPWVFTPDEADQIRREAVRGPWQPNQNSVGLRSMSTVVTMPMSQPMSQPRPQVETPEEASVARVADGLRSTPPISAGRLRGARVPSVPGLYAWWHEPGLLPRVTHGSSGPTLCAEGTLELAYVGIANSLHGRLTGDHLGSSTGSSTLRRALGAWMGEERGWATEWRNSRVQHDATSERALTTWMEQHLHVTWVKHESPRDVEVDVIPFLAPPLNHQFNRGHPNWPALDTARRAWRKRGTPQGE